MANLTRILNNQIYSKTIIASQKIADGTITGSLFSSNVTVPGDFLITGNLFVLGSSQTTTVASTNTYVNDPLIVMNNGFAGTNTYDEGFVFNRGTALNQAFIWNEFNKEFRLIATSETGTTYGNINQTSFSTLRIGNIRMLGDANIGTINAGSLNYAVIGNTNPNSAYFTTLNASGNVLLGLTQASALNATPIGNATPATAAFTTLTSSGITTVTNATAATLLGEGAFRVTGGASILGNLWIGGNLNVLGNSFTITSNAGVFYGNTAGFGALYAGVTGFVPQAQTVIQVTSNFNGYSQINQQNINNGVNASSDYIATADNGTAADTYIDMGINSSGFTPSATQGPNDGYLYLHGNTVTGGGNLLIASVHNDVVFATNGTDITNVVEYGRITAGNTFVIKSAVPSTSTTTGALQVAGGVGIGGRLYVASGIQNTTIGNVTPAEAYFTNVSVSGNIVTGLLQAAAINATPIGNATASTGAFTTLSATQGIWANSTTASTTTSTGAIVVAGGVGISGNLNVGGNIVATGATILKNTLRAEGQVTLTDATNAISISNGGALTVAGGAAFAKDVYIGGNLVVANIVSQNYQILSVSDPLLYLNANVPYPYSYDIGIFSHFVGSGLSTLANVYQHTGIVRDNADNTWKFFSNAAEPTGGTVTFDSNTVYDPVKAGNLFLVNTTDATNAISGALIVSGGAGIGGNIFQTGTRHETSASNFLLATTPTTVDAFKSATTLNIGANSGTLTIGNPTVVGTQTTQSLFDTVATTVNFARTGNVTLGAPTGSTIIQGNIAVNSVTESTSSSTGAIKTSGGAGIAGNIFHGGTQLQTSASNYIFASTPNTVDAFASASTLNIGYTTGTLTLKNQTVVGTQTTQNLYNTIATAINFGGTANVTMGTPSGVTIVAGGANIQAVTTSTNSATGALKVMGGVGVRGNLNIAGDNTGTPYSGRGAVTVGLDLTGTLYPENLAQFTSNANSFSRISIQNISTQQNATSEFIAIANNGSNIGGYVATGVSGLNFNSTAIASIIKPGDGYTYATGNLVLFGSNDLILSAGGATQVFARVSSAFSNIGIQTITPATSSTTGALTTVGGVGVGTNLYVGKGATINSTNGVESFKVLSSFSSNVAIYANTAPTGGNAGPTSSFTETVIIGGGNLQVQPGAILKVSGATSMMIPTGPSSARPSSQGGNDVAGMIRFNTTTNVLEFYDGTQWTVAGSTFTVITDRQFAGNSAGSFGNVDGTNTTFTIQSTATTAGTLVSINGVMQFPVLAYSVSGSTLTFTEPPAPGDVIDVRILTTTAQVSALASGNGLNQFITDATGSSIWTGTSSTTERILVDQVGNLNFLTGNKVTYDQTKVNIPNAAAAVVVDTFYQSAYSTAKYIVSAKKDATTFESMEALLITDGAGNAYVSTYGIVNNGTALGTLSANVVGANVNLYYTSTSATNANVKVMTTYIV
jgi:hypothetical protein